MLPSLKELLSHLDSQSLGEFFSDATLARGRQYVGRVRHIEAQANTLSARVQGSAAQPYRTEAQLRLSEYFGELSLEISSHCSCPLGGRCKHVVALLLAAQRPGVLVDTPRQIVLDWARSLPSMLAKQRSNQSKKIKANRQALFYLLHPSHGGLVLEVHKGRCDEAGNPLGDTTLWSNAEQALLKPPSFVSDEDLPVLRQMLAVERSLGRGYWQPLPVVGSAGAGLMHALQASHRAWFVAEPGGSGAALFDDAYLLCRGPTRPGQLVWQQGPKGLSPQLQCTPGAYLLHTEPFLYLGEDGSFGAVELEEADVVRHALMLPPLNPSELPLVAAALASAAPRLPAPAAQELPLLEEALQAVLRLDSVHVWQRRAHRDYPGAYNTLHDYAVARFRYGDVSIDAFAKDELVTRADGSAVRLRRDKAGEAQALAALNKAGFKPINAHLLHTVQTLPADVLGLAREEDWENFFPASAAALRAAGWRIECDAQFRHHVLQVDAWHAELEEDANGWFALSLGIEVDGQRLDLAPLLYALFRRDPRWLDRSALEAIKDEELVRLETPDGAPIKVPAARIKPLATTLVDLFDHPSEGALKLPVMDAPRLQQALDQTDWALQGAERLAQWVTRLQAASKLRAVDTPTGFAGSLRPYQRDGLAWMQHLRTHELGGILADDMGLGKTAQTLAHLLCEKESGRMQNPCLVVLPTSLVFNWQQEAARFTPALRVLKLHGATRATRFDEIAAHDLVLSTYPLLARDREALTQQHWHYLVLDEAQAIKNPRSQAAQVVRELHAQHRLCLTGTPLENHLGELWAQFDFLMPGLLGDSKQFTQSWRNPIEKQGNLLRRELLAKRLAPFILRRKKQEVASELPPKSVMLRSIALEGRQRDLYETVRATMDKRIREEIAARGFARSQIVILDALLKLRQVCCDPRLLDTPAAKKVKESAKLDLLMDLLPGLVEEGRRVLLFSQFTSMLDLIGAALDAAKISWLRLDGSTTKRQEVVEAFQNGSTPVFLISLKAGGVGLNLTAADTVIHFDPWWNPAAEDQATDRAHRIGQTKNVFVYKLVVAGSIEEKILALQDKKAALAAGILSEEGSAAAKFSETDLSELFAPLAD